MSVRIRKGLVETDIDRERQLRNQEHGALAYNCSTEPSYLGHMQHSRIAIRYHFAADILFSAAFKLKLAITSCLCVLLVRQTMTERRFPKAEAQCYLMGATCS